MATRRKYRERVPVDDASIPAGPEIAPTSPAGPIAAPPDDGNALRQAHEATVHAEELQTQHGMRQQMGLPEPAINPEERKAIDAHIDRMDLSPHKARFLKSHPSLLMEPYSQLMSHAYMLAKNAGIEDDTAAMDNAILHGIARDLEHHRQLSQLTAAQARPSPDNEQRYQDAGEAAHELTREADAIFAEGGAVAPAPAPAPRKSYPLQAPVSRGAVDVKSGTRSPTAIHLSRDEVQIAHAAFKHLPPHEAERAYAQNRKLMHEMKRDGRIQGDR